MVLEDFKDLQDAELQVIQSIFSDEFEVAETKTPWKSVNAAHEFRILIHPVEEKLKGSVSVKLHFKLPLRYPKVIPTLKLEDPKGLNSIHLTSLAQSLQQFSSTLLGTEMIYELSTHAATYITDHNTLSHPSGSLGDLRLHRSAELEKEALKKEKEAKEREDELEKEEAKRLAGLIGEDWKRKEGERKEREKEKVKELEIREGVVEMGVVLEDGDEWKAEVSVWESKNGGGGEKKEMGRWLEAEVEVLSPVYSGALTPPLSTTRKVMASAQVFDILSSYFLTSQAKRKLSKIESDLRQLEPLRHPSLLSLYGYHLHLYTPTFLPSSSPSNQNPFLPQKTGYTLLILSSSLASFLPLNKILSISGTISLEKTLEIIKKLLEVVEFLHEKEVLHKAIRVGRVWIGGKEVRLEGGLWGRRLVDLNKSNPWTEAGFGGEELPESWSCPEALDEPFAYSKPRDLWDLGIVFAQMIFGIDIHKKFSAPGDLIRSIPKQSPIRKLLHDILNPDSKKRPTATQLLQQVTYLPDPTQHQLSFSSFNSLNQQQSPTSTTPPTSSAFPLQIPQPTTPRPRSDLQLSKSIEAGGVPVGFFWQPRPSGSRYKAEFEELEFLGRGGGGQVVKARNRLDGHLYAVKKIRLPEERSSEEKILREVTIWSRMNHPNIVRYHTSWVEADDYKFDDSSMTDGSSRITESISTSDALQAASQPKFRSSKSNSGSSNSSSSSTSSSKNSTPTDFDADEDHELQTLNFDLDLGLEDFDDEAGSTDFLSVGHSRSLGYPMIHFGNDDDDDAPGSGNQSVGVKSPVVSRRETRANSPMMESRQRVARTLYIQMEYVEKLTLKEAIEEGETEVDAWRHMFQILSAMLHFTSLNIIHRDLKPSNIFLDVKGDVRIGDFGLAVNQGLADPADALLSLESSMEEADLTSGVGTSLYIAPETLSRGRNARSVKYSNKIDMYSLGIVFFELFHPFKTGMERIQVLRELRKPEIIFPASWDMVKLARHTKIVQRCLAHDPERRASPKDLLNSDLLPPRVGDDSIEETIRLLSHSGSTHAQTLITALFNQTDEDRMRKDFSYDFYDGEGAKVDNDPYGEMVRNKLSRIFRQKGAVCMDSPLLMPHSQIYASRKPVRLLDTDGTIACLPFQLNIPFCRMVARDQSLTRLKRWTIAPVYRVSTAGGQPRAVLNAAFDIVTDAVTAASEAECLYVIEEIMAAFPLSGDTVHFVNHSKLLDAVIEKVPSNRRPAFLEILVQHGRLRRPWSKTSVELLKIHGVNKSVVNEMGLLDFTGNIAEVRSRLINMCGTLKHGLEDAFRELEEIISLSRQLGVRNIKVSPLLATNWDFHRNGVLFESHHVKSKSREIIAAGGRFDDVVARLAAPEIRYSGRCPHVVGFSLSVAVLSAAAAEANTTSGKASMSNKNESLRSYGPWAVRRCDAYVVSFAKGLVEQRLEVVSDLWKAGIKADLMYDDDFLSLTLEQLVNACKREGILWLIIVKGSSDRRIAVDESERSLKVKSVLRGYEEEVSRLDLISWLSKELREQSITDERHHIGPSASDSIPEPISVLPEPTKSAQEYHVILEDERHKGKHKQRTMTIYRAQKNIELASAAAADAPVFCVDLDGVAFRKMSLSAAWVTDDDVFRSIVQNAPPSKRDYLNSIRKGIQQHRSHQLPSFWLFSLREDRSVFLTFDT